MRPPVSRMVALALGFGTSVIAACDVGDVGDVDAPDPETAPTIGVALVLDGDHLEVLSTSPRAEPRARPQPSANIVSYRFVDEDERTIAAGLVEDPRAATFEWFDETGAVERADATRATALLELELPAVDGELVLVAGGEEIARGAVFGSAPPLTLFDQSRIPALGEPVLIYGTGRKARSLDILYLSDGYTRQDFDEFAATAASHVEELFEDRDWRAHRDRINVWRLDVPSPDRGIVPAGTPSTSAFGTFRHAPPLERALEPSAEGKLLAAEIARRYNIEQAVILARTREYGASGGLVAVVGITSGHTLGHELGHSVLHLDDEYAYGLGACAADGYASINIASSPSALPWAARVLPGTSLPTPPSAGPGVIGAFEGGRYCAQNRYRPELDCLMNHLGQPMCAVCRGAMNAYFAAVSARTTDTTDDPPTDP